MATRKWYKNDGSLDVGSVMVRRTNWISVIFLWKATVGCKTIFDKRPQDLQKIAVGRSHCSFGELDQY